MTWRRICRRLTQQELVVATSTQSAEKATKTSTKQSESSLQHAPTRKILPAPHNSAQKNQQPCLPRRSSGPCKQTSNCWLALLIWLGSHKPTSCLCRYLPVLQFVALLTAPVTALYAVGGLVASPVIIPAIILKNLVVLVRLFGQQAGRQQSVLPHPTLHCTTRKPSLVPCPSAPAADAVPASSLFTCCPHAGHLHTLPPDDPADCHPRWLHTGHNHAGGVHCQVLLRGAESPAVAPLLVLCR